MSASDRRKWEARYASPAPVMGVGPKPALRALASAFPVHGWALDVAAGEGQNAVWLAERGLSVHAVELSRHALAKAEALAQERGVHDHLRCWQHDLDRGLPKGLREGYDVVSSVHFWPGPALGAELVARVLPGGLFLLVVLSAEPLGVGPAAPGARFRVHTADAQALVPGWELLACELEGHELRLLARAPWAAHPPACRRGPEGPG